MNGLSVDLEWWHIALCFAVAGASIALLVVRVVFPDFYAKRQELDDEHHRKPWLGD
jgi:hypothetical protein